MESLWLWSVVVVETVTRCIESDRVNSFGRLSMSLMGHHIMELKSTSTYSPTGTTTGWKSLLKFSP